MAGNPKEEKARKYAYDGKEEVPYFSVSALGYKVVYFLSCAYKNAKNKAQNRAKKASEIGNYEACGKV